jgi:hypothetical protein
MAMHIKFLQQQYNVLSPKNLIPWRDLNPGFAVLEAVARTTMHTTRAIYVPI